MVHPRLRARPRIVNGRSGCESGGPKKKWPRKARKTGRGHFESADKQKGANECKVRERKT